MRFTQFLNEKYKENHKCKTPNAIYSTNIHTDSIEIKIKLPMKVDLSKEESEDLESDLHYAIEKELARLFK